MRQVLRKGLSSIVVEDVPDPLALPHHVVVRPAYSLISSGTETASIHKDGVLKEVADNPSHLRKVWNVAMANGPLSTLREVRAKFSDYAVLGYSGAGMIIDKHPSVTDLEIGDRVAYGGEGTGHGESILTGRKLVAPVPPSVPLDHACFTTLGSIAMNAVRIAQIELGDTVVVLGLGLVGQLIAQLARMQGGTVIATDLRADRVALARSLGSDHAIEGGDDLADRVRALTNGRGADCVLIAAASKSSAPCEEALRLCRDRGRMVVVGAVGMSFPWNDMYLKEIQLYMARAYGPGSYDPSYEREGRDYPVAYVRWTEQRNMEEVLRLLETGRLQVAPLITDRYPLGAAASAYEKIMDPAAASLGVVLEYPEATANIPAPVRRVALHARAATSGRPTFALVGAGNIARWAHLPSLRAAGGELRAVYSANGARGKSYANRFGAAYCTTDYEEILKDVSVDVVLIASRNQSHAKQVLRALDSGKHVFVEKPLALTEDECRQIAAAQRRSGCVVSVGFNRRFAPYYVEQRRTLARRTSPAVITCRINSPGISGSYWMADPSSGGAILGEACHFVDLLYWLLDSEPKSVAAYSLPTDRAEPIGENNIVASFTFADGSIANLTYCTVGSATSAGERVEVFAPGLGSSSENFKTLSVFTSARRRHSKFFAQKGYEQQMAGFVEALRTGAPPAVSVDDGVRATVGCLRILDAARSGQPQAVEWRHLVE
jgi:predicted dehydrogenase/threonine dehydrogenase-like Zn-dependent dehydrogenase